MYHVENKSFQTPKELIIQKTSVSQSEGDYEDSKYTRNGALGFCTGGAGLGQIALVAALIELGCLGPVIANFSTGNATTGPSFSRINRR